MFNIIEQINNQLIKVYQALEKFNYKDLAIKICLTCFISGCILGVLSSIERIAAYGIELSPVKQLLILFFTTGLLGLSGLIAGGIQFFLLFITAKLFIVLTNLATHANKLYPYKVLVLYSLFGSGVAVYLLILFFIEAPSDFVAKFFTSKFFLALVLNFSFYLIIILLTFILWLIIKYLIYRFKLTSTLKLKYLIPAALTIWIGVVLFYLTSGVFSNYLSNSAILGGQFFSTYNLYWTKVLTFYSKNIIAFDILAFIGFSIIFLIINFSFVWFIKKILTFKYIKLVLFVCSALLFWPVYLLSQNLLPTQIFYNAIITSTLAILASLTFVLIEILLFTAPAIFNKDVLSESLRSKKIINVAISVYLVIFVTGIVGFVNFDSVKAFVYRYHTTPKLVLAGTRTLILKEKLPLIPPEISKLNTDSKTDMKVSFDRKPDIILITLDAMRNDIFQDYISNKTNPLNDIIRQSTNITTAYSHAPYTVASFSSLFSSKSLSSRSDTDYYTLADILSAGGYQTYSLTVYKNKENFEFINLKKKLYPSLFSKGFQIVDKPGEKPFEYQKDSILSAKFDQFLRHRDKSRPLFAWIHYAQLHLIPSSEIFNNVFGNKSFLNRYNKALNNEKASFNRLITSLKNYNLLDNSIIIITADHGEGAKEHGDLFHIFALYGEYVKVPLIIKLPSQKNPQKLEQPISLIDLVPTIYEYLGYKGPDLNLDGISFLPAIQGKDFKKRPVPIALYMYKEKTLISFSLYGKKDEYDKSILETSIVDENNEWKLIENYYFGFKELYNLKNDPAEKNNLIDEKKPVAGKMLRKLHNTLFLKK